MRKWGIVAACALLALVVVGITVLRPSEEDRIRKVLERFTHAVAVRTDDQPLSRLGRIRSETKETVTDDVFVAVPDLGIRVVGRSALADSAAKAGVVFQSADCVLTGTTIKIDESATTAKVDALAVVTGSRGGERKVDRRPVHFLLRKDESWKITTIDVATSQDP